MELAAIPAWKTAPTLAYETALILKPARDAPLTGLHLARRLTDLDATAVHAACASAFWSAGQRCTATRRSRAG